MIDPMNDELLTLTVAAKLVPSRPSLSTVYRWYLYGVRGHRLETLLVGGKRMTSKAAVVRFIRALSESADGANATAIHCAERQHEIDRAAKLCEAAGI